MFFYSEENLLQVRGSQTGSTRRKLPRTKKRRPHRNETEESSDAKSTDVFTSFLPSEEIMIQRKHLIITWDIKFVIWVHLKHTSRHMVHTATKSGTRRYTAAKMHTAPTHGDTR